MMQRRDFLSTAGIAAAGSLLGPSLPAGAATVDAAGGSRSPNAPRRLRVLMLGGTHFLGPTLVGTFLDRGHDVTLFNRGLTNPHLFTYLERLRGDREDERGTGLDALRGRDWDVVIDTWQKGPKCVEDTARLLSGHVGAYFYVSSIAVYHSSAYQEIGSAETAPLRELAGQPVDRSPDSVGYNLRKTLAEKLLQENFDGAVALFRSHGMRGDRIPAPNDEPYWPIRIWRGGKVLTPEEGRSWGQFTDVVSLCRFVAHCAENNLSGPYNVMSRPFHLVDYLTAIRNVTHSDAEFIWTSRETLAGFDIEPYRNLPMWRPEPAGYYHFSAERAFRAGFTARPLESSVVSMLEGYFRRFPDDSFRFGGSEYGMLPSDREAEVLAALGH